MVSISMRRENRLAFNDFERVVVVILIEILRPDITHAHLKRFLYDSHRALIDKSSEFDMVGSRVAGQKGVILGDESVTGIFAVSYVALMMLFPLWKFLMAETTSHQQELAGDCVLVLEELLQVGSQFMEELAWCFCSRSGGHLPAQPSSPGYLLRSGYSPTSPGYVPLPCYLFPPTPSFSPSISVLLTPIADLSLSIVHTPSHVLLHHLCRTLPVSVHRLHTVPSSPSLHFSSTSRLTAYNPPSWYRPLPSYSPPLPAHTVFETQLQPSVIAPPSCITHRASEAGFFLL
ncbi:hypothetical protein Acr_00g0064200 [Actinidia rufa]|uniref:Uncharacterized protein n=1 Tax=Actinidia rufa TaxID=165716 RepID=A0A7J0DPG5_9ERIC|nr:hypothetical protein Acr_00g0064200 [Actinidia rufa]